MTRVTKRKYAHELYPHADEYESRPLRVEVPYLYARALGHEVAGTSWFMLTGGDKEAIHRTLELISARRIAFLADAMLQGLTGEDAWAWADQRASEESGEWVFERAVHYGVDPEQIKPYLCGPEPERHDHAGEYDPRIGGRLVIRVQGKESECGECTELAAEEVPS